MSVKSDEEIAYNRASRLSGRVLRCATCGEEIVGKAWRISDSPPRFACTRCNSQRPGQ